MNAIMPRATIEQIVAFHDATMTLYEVAYDKMEEAEEALKAARAMARNTHPGITSFTYDHQDEIKAFDKALVLPPRENYLRTARKLLDVNTWAYVIERTDLERLMDHEAKKTLRDQMKYVPDRVGRDGQLITGEEAEKGMPPITIDNIRATLEHFYADAGMIFQRGIANAFSKLDRRFRSHDGFKVGSRMILTYAFDPNYGTLNYGKIEDQLIDIERVFSILDDKPEATFTSAIRELRNSRSGGRGPRQSEMETEYFKIRGFKNGNAHLWFLRDDLVEKVNKLLADYYGEVIGDGQTKEADPFADVKHAPARYYGFFPTPADAGDQLFSGRWQRGIYISRRTDEPQIRILEPSAGTGNLARRCFSTPMVPERDYDWAREQAAKYNAEHRFDNLVDCIEIQPHLAAQLEAERIYNRVFCEDFLRVTPEMTGLYDVVVMNPPFDRERDIDHVVHALKFLKPGGQLGAIMSAGTELRETKKAIAFRALVAELGGEFEDLPAGSFAESGTYVNTCIVRLRKKG